MDLTAFKDYEGKELVYLVKVEYINRTLLKIGFSKGLKGRMDAYESHNPEIQLLKVREGDKYLEGLMHEYFSEFSYPKRREWFYYNDRIVSEFDTLDENRYLSINQLKAKVSNLLKPKTILELKKLYYERYGEEIEKEKINRGDLNYLLTDVFSFLNREIGKFIDSLDYSEIPTELNPDIQYIISIPNPISDVDISMDLKQILGRQGLKENPWKNTAKMLVKIISKAHKLKKEDFDKRLEEKRQNSINLLNSYARVDDINKHVLAEKYQKVAETYHYRDDYVAVNEHAGKDLIPIFNNLMMVSEMRSFEVQQTDYSDRFTVINAINDRSLEGVRKEVISAAEVFNNINNSVDKLRMLVELSEGDISEKDLTDFLSLIPAKFKDYYTEMGPERIKANSYKENRLKEEWVKNHQEERGGLVMR